MQKGKEEKCRRKGKISADIKRRGKRGMRGGMGKKRAKKKGREGSKQRDDMQKE